MRRLLPSPRQRGYALLVVMGCAAVMALFVAQASLNVQRDQALIARDKKLRTLQEADAKVRSLLASKPMCTCNMRGLTGAFTQTPPMGRTPAAIVPTSPIDIGSQARPLGAWDLFVDAGGQVTCRGLADRDVAVAPVPPPGPSPVGVAATAVAERLTLEQLRTVAIIPDTPDVPIVGGVLRMVSRASSATTDERPVTFNNFRTDQEARVALDIEVTSPGNFRVERCHEPEKCINNREANRARWCANIVRRAPGSGGFYDVMGDPERDFLAQGFRSDAYMNNATTVGEICRRMGCSETGGRASGRCWRSPRNNRGMSYLWDPVRREYRWMITRGSRRNRCWIGAVRCQPLPASRIPACVQPNRFIRFR